MGIGFLKPQRIEPGQKVAAHPIGANQHQCANRIEGSGARLLRAARRLRRE